MKTVRRPTPVVVSKNLYNPSDECWKTQVLRVAEIQKISKGRGAVMCFIDDGVFANSELLNRVQNPMYSYLEKGDFFGEHSTNGATIVGGNTIGIFPEMQFISKQVLDPISGVGPMKAIVSAINKATELDIKCINLSLGSDDYDRSLDNALKKYCSDGKRIATVAAGNDSNLTDWPAQLAKTIKGVLSIAATQIDEKGNVSIALFSSYGVITVAAPGHGLKTMTIDNRIDFVSGTSFAAPIVGAMISVAQSLNKNLTQDQILSYLKETSKKMKETESRQGFGNIDIVEFLKKVKNNEPFQKVKVKKSIFSKFCEIFSSPLYTTIGLLDKLKEVFAAEYRIIGDDLIFEREDYFDSLKTKVLLDVKDHCLEEELRISWSTSEAISYGEYAYSQDAYDFEGNSLIKPGQFYADKVEYNLPFNPAQKGKKSRILTFGVPSFMFDTKSFKDRGAFNFNLLMDEFRDGPDNVLEGFVFSSLGLIRKNDLKISGGTLSQEKLLVLEPNFNRKDAMVVKKFFNKIGTKNFYSYNEPMHINENGNYRELLKDFYKDVDNPRLRKDKFTVSDFTIECNCEAIKKSLKDFQVSYVKSEYGKIVYDQIIIKFEEDKVSLDFKGCRAFC